jgi:predicted nuclease with RNAse H fold
MSWFGADPGGMRNNEPCFGVAWLRIDGTFETDTTDCAYEAMKWMMRRLEPPGAVGIDCPLWWSSCKSAARQIDVVLRRKYRHRIGQSVQSINSLRGAVLVQGVMLASLVRQQFPNMPITETHPKALLKAKHLEAQGRSHIASDFGFYGAEPKSDDRVDALVSAAVARNGSTNLWKTDLAELPRRAEEMDPQHTFFGPVNYLWFEKVSE